jgi:hypothetical protein
MRFLTTVGLLLLVLAALGCNPPASVPVDDPPDPLYVDPETRDFSQNPGMLERVLGSPHGYLRFINVPFSQELCRHFGQALVGSPPFNLHGDAHLEQYAVTDLGRGLTDFDDSSTGPAILDLMRFGTSLYLATDARGWSEHADAVYDEFLRGYREALDDPSTEAPEPEVVRRLQAEFEYDRGKYFEWVESIMEPVSANEKQELMEAMTGYFKAMLRHAPELGTGFFDVQDVGYLKMGIGSALDIKYLVRIRGLSDDSGDDIVLEVKQVRDLTGIDCISAGLGSDPFRILIGQSGIAYQPYELLGYVRMRDLTFWVHAWVDNYTEVAIDQTFESPEELAEVAYDIGVQLGRGHPTQLEPPLDVQARFEQIRLLDLHQTELKTECRAFADRVTAAWDRFRAAAASD